MLSLLRFLPLLIAFPALAQVSFRVHLPDDAGGPYDGRVIVSMISQSSSLPAGVSPSDAPFFSDPQPMAGTSVKAFSSEHPVLLGASETTQAFPVPLSQLPAGEYRAEAVLDIHQHNSSWSREPGNRYSDEVSFSVVPGGPTIVDFTLSREVAERELPDLDGLTWIEVRSDLLSEFRGEDVMLRAGVVHPLDQEKGRRYPVVYHVPGFGGDHTGARREHRRRVYIREQLAKGEDVDPVSLELASSSFAVTLDPEGPNGHTLFADSANNGPVGRALNEELLPAIDAALPTIAEPAARLLRGHSSGGWTVVHLALTYPETFGRAWSTAPDPVDFSAFQLVDIYQDANAYLHPSGEPIPSYRDRDGNPGMTIRDENAMEEALGPRNSAAQQWDSWFAVFGPRDADGHPAALFDPVTGAIDRQIADSYRGYDIAERLRRDPRGIGRLLRERVRLICGEGDNFYLNRAAGRLAVLLDELHPAATPNPITVTTGDHGTVMRSEAARAIPAEMLSYLASQEHGTLSKIKQKQLPGND